MSKFFNFFTGHSTDGKGISKDKAKKDIPLNFINYFKMFFMKFGVIINGNLLFLICNFPIIICFFGFLGYFNTVSVAPLSPFYANIYGAYAISGMNAPLAALDGVLGATRSIGVISTTTQVLLYIGFLCIFTFGFANIGCTYITRNTVRRESVYAWSDFWYSIRKNWKQGFILGIFDSIVLIVLFYNSTYFYQLSANFLYMVFYFITLAIALIYLMMRPYLYILATTFTYKIKQIINYSLRLSMLGLKRNFLALISFGIIAYITVLLVTLNPFIGVFFPLFFSFGIISFTNTYAAYPVAIKYLLDKNEEKKTEKKHVRFDEVDYDDDDDPVFKDRG